LEKVEPTPAKAQVQPDVPAASAPSIAAEDGDAPPAASGEQSEPSAQNQAATDDAERAAAVSNLEEEMARLLGQITSKGDS
jgi:hypothetical protein